MGNDGNYYTFVACNVVLLGLIGLIQMGYGAATFAFSKNYGFGSWYVGMLCIFLAASSLGFRYEIGRNCYTVFAAVCATVAFIGWIVDLNGSSMLKSLDICGNDQGYAGDQTLIALLISNCDLIQRSGSDTCYCMAAEEDYRCRLFVEQDGFSADDCSPVLSDYGRLAGISGGMAFLMFFLSAVFSCAGCGAYSYYYSQC